MIFSIEQNFSDREVVTASGASENIIDLGETETVLNGPAALVRDIGRGRPIPIRIQLVEDANAPADTLDVDLQVSTDEAFTSPVTVASSPQLTAGVAGSRVAIYYIPENTDLRYMRLNYTVGGTSPSFTIMAGIVLGDQTADGLAGV